MQEEGRRKRDNDTIDKDTDTPEEEGHRSDVIKFYEIEAGASNGAVENLRDSESECVSYHV